MMHDAVISMVNPGRNTLKESRTGMMDVVLFNFTFLFQC